MSFEARTTAPEHTIFDTLRSKAAVLAGSTVAFFTVGLATRVSDANSIESQSAPALAVEKEQSVPIFRDLNSWLNTESIILGNSTQTNEFASSVAFTAEKNPWRTIQKWGQQSDALFHINPYDEGKTDHQSQTGYGDLTTKHGLHNKYVLKLRPGIKRIGAYGIRQPYIDDNGKPHHASKEILKPKNKTTYIDPRSGQFAYSSFNVFVAKVHAKK